MEDATLSAMNSHAKKVQSSQGGTDVNQGMDGVGNPGVLGDHKNPTFYTKQDDNRESATPNKMHEV
jgi:hypothetical protein